MNSLPRLLAHRGLRTLAPENTLAAFQLCRDHGIAGVELDVRLSRDGLPVIIHDPHVKTGTGGKVDVAETDYADLLKIDVGSDFHPPFIGELLPSLDATLTLLAHLNLFVNIEIKPEPLGRTEALVTAVANSLSKFCPTHQPEPVISSFDPAILETCQHILPEIPRGLCVEGQLPEDWPTLLAKLGCQSFHPEHGLLRKDLVAEIHGHNLKIATWVVNDQARFDELCSWGVDCIISDVPESLTQES